ncbi:MAG: hypothetical protein WBM07_03640, partial [Chitinivibrionales bacterium]
RYTVENTSSAPETLLINPGCQYDMTIVKPPRDTLYHYLKLRACTDLIETIVLQPNQVLTMDFPGWESDSAYDSLRVSAMLAGLAASAASIDIRFEQPVTGINAHAAVVPFKDAMIAYERPSNVLTLSVASARSIKVDLYGLDGRKIAALFDREQCGPGTYRFPLNRFTMANRCMIAKLKSGAAVSIVPITMLR